jgi:hypothetical protein
MGQNIGRVLGGVGPIAGLASSFIPGVGPFIGPAITALSTMLPGLIGGGPKAPSLTPPSAPTTSAAPMGPPPTPEIPTSSATGISTFTPGPGPSSAAGAGPIGTDLSPYANMIASNMMTNNPFAMFQSQ